MEERRVEYIGRWGKDGPWVLVEGVPADVCTQCGEEFFRSDVAAGLNRAIREGAADGARTVPVTVRDFGSVGQAAQA